MNPKVALQAPCALPSAPPPQKKSRERKLPGSLPHKTVFSESPQGIKFIEHEQLFSRILENIVGRPSFTALCKLKSIRSVRQGYLR